MTGTRSTGSRSSRSLPVTMRETSSRSSMSCACARGVALDDSRARAAPSLASSCRVPQHARPAEDGVERRAQLVRQGGEELVLGAVGVCSLPRGAAACSRARTPGCGRLGLEPRHPEATCCAMVSASRISGGANACDGVEVESGLAEQPALVHERDEAERAEALAPRRYVAAARQARIVEDTMTDRPGRDRSRGPRGNCRQPPRPRYWRVTGLRRARSA